MAAHTNLQRQFIVRKLAAFYTPRDIAALFVAIFRDTACTEADVLANDPRVNILDPELHALFATERERVLQDPLSAQFSDQKARLIALSRQAERYESNNQPAEARAVYRQIAEELGVVSKSAGGKVPAAPMGEQVVSITRTIVDPQAPVEAAQ